MNYDGYGLKGSTLYVTLFPCNDCAKAIIQKGIKKVVYLDDKYSDQDTTKASKLMFDAAKVSYVKYELRGKDITINL